MTRLDEFFEAVFGDGHGYAALSFGRHPNVATFYEWPRQKRQLVADARRRKTAENVFFCPALRTSTETSDNGGLVEALNPPVEPMPCLWADIDLVGKDGAEKEVNHTLLDELDPIRVQSGHEGHLHVYVPLLEGIDAPTHKTLNTALKEALGGDHKQNSVSWLRLPGTINHKSDLDRPPVKLIKVRGTRHDANDLSASLSPWMTRSRDYTHVTAPGAQHVDWASLKRHLPDNVRRAFADDNTGDGRGIRTFALVAACRESKIRGRPITFDETIAIVEHFPPAVDKYGWRDGGVAKQVEDCWNNYSRKSTQVNGKPTPARRASKKSDSEGDDRSPKLKITRASEIQPLPQRWLWHDRLPLGALTLLGGVEGTGKSTTCIDIAAQVTRGDLEGEYKGVPKSVVYLAHEDSWTHSIVSRLIAAKANRDLILNVTVEEDNKEGWVNLPGHLELVRDLIQTEQVGLIVLDPIISVLSASLKLEDPRSLRSALEPINHLADETQCAILGIHHFNKRASADGGELFSGLRVWRSVARATLILVPELQEKDHFILSNDKNNNAPADVKSIMGQIATTHIDTQEGQARTSHIKWNGLTDVHATDLLRQAMKPPKAEKPKHHIDQWLIEELKDGPVAAADIKERGEAMGFAYSTVARRFTNHLGGIPKKSGYGDAGWVWQLPSSTAVIVTNDAHAMMSDINDENDENDTHLTRNSNFSSTSTFLNDNSSPHTHHSRHTHHSSSRGRASTLAREQDDARTYRDYKPATERTVNFATAKPEPLWSRKKRNRD